MWSGGDDALQRRLDDLLRRRRDDVEREAVALDRPPRGMRRERCDVLLQPDALADLDEVLPPHAAVLRVVQEQVGQLAALLHQVEPRQARHLAPRSPALPSSSLSTTPGVVEAQRLVEVARQQVVLGHASEYGGRHDGVVTGETTRTLGSPQGRATPVERRLSPREVGRPPSSPRSGVTARGRQNRRNSAGLTAAADGDVRGELADEPRACRVDPDGIGPPRLTLVSSDP